MTKLRLMAVGTGRDGTVSLNHFLNQLFLNEGKGRQSCHEYASRECYNTFDRFSFGDQQALQPVAQMLNDCPFDALVGNGLAFVLPHLRETVSKDVRFIHLQRRDRTACIGSFLKLCQLFPQAMANYTERTDVEFLVQRTAAFHIGEMSRAEWERLPLFDRFAWYYDKTHELLTQSASWFTHSMHVYTEDLNSQATLQRIAEFAGVETTEPFTAPHKNALSFGDISRIDPFFTDKAQWLYSNFDFNEGVRNDTHPIDYFCERFIAWKGHQLSNEAKGELAKYMQPLPGIVEDMDKFIGVLEGWLTKSRQLKEYVAQRLGIDEKPSVLADSESDQPEQQAPHYFTTEVAVATCCLSQENLNELRPSESAEANAASSALSTGLVESTVLVATPG